VDRTEFIRNAFRNILLREPAAEELSAAQELKSASLCQALLNLNEFIYVE
jgi:hypothetical protein